MIVRIFRVVVLAFFVLISTRWNSQAEYRAYILEIFDHIDQTTRVETTGFSPDKYIHTHGGPDRVSAMVKATWHCYGDTSKYRSVCLMPKPITPKFNLGDRVRVTLKKHITEDWIGVVEIALYREDVKSNVYGLRFTNRRNLYGRYFEFDLELVERQKKEPVEKK